MARLGRKPVRPGRVTVAMSLGAVGLFLISMSTGLGSWPLGAVGAAMLIVAVALLTTASMQGAEKAFVAGTVHVVKVSEPPLSSEFGRCELQVLVDAPGHPGQTAIIRDARVPVSKWPDVGETLPALVSVADARRVKIQWDRVGTHGERFEESYQDFDSYYQNDPGLFDDLHGPPTDQQDHLGDDPYLGDPYLGYDDEDDRIGLDQIPVTHPEPLHPGNLYTGNLYGEALHDDPPPSGARRPSPHRRHAPAPVAVLEGELLTAEVPSPRTPIDDADPELDDINLIDFSDIPEPPAPSAAGAPGSAAGAPGSTTAGTVARVDAATSDTTATSDTAATDTTLHGNTAAAADHEPAVDEASLDEPAVDASASGDLRAAADPATAAQSPALDLLADAASPYDDLVAASPNARPSVASSIHGVGITMLVNDLNRSLKFYRDMLGFYEIDGGPGNVVLASGDTRVVLRSAQDVGAVNRRLVHLNLEVGEVDAVYRELKIRGVRFTYAPRIVNRGERLELWAAAFKDPDGHGIAITQWKAA